MAIENRDAVVHGTKLAVVYKGVKYTCTAESSPLFGNRLAFRDDRNGDLYNSLSTLGNKITNSSVNGWRFWTIESELGQPRARRVAGTVANAPCERCGHVNGTPVETEDPNPEGSFPTYSGPALWAALAAPQPMVIEAEAAGTEPATEAPANVPAPNLDGQGRRGRKAKLAEAQAAAARMNNLIPA